MIEVLAVAFGILAAVAGLYALAMKQKVRELERLAEHHEVNMAQCRLTVRKLRQALLAERGG